MREPTLKKNVRERFSQKASSYDQAAVVQKGMAHRLRNQLIQTETKPQEILEIGCGTGYLTKLLFEQYLGSAYVALDIAEGMIVEMQRRFPHETERCQFVLADVEEWSQLQEAEKFDLVVSNACFQWLEHPDQTFFHLYRLLTKRGRISFTTFGPETFYELHSSFCAAYRSLGNEAGQKHGISFLSQSEWDQKLCAVGFQNIQIQTYKEVIYYPSVWDFMLAVKSIGANSSQAYQSNGLGSRKLLLEMIRQYEKKYRNHKGIPVTYEVICVLGERVT